MNRNDTSCMEKKRTELHMLTNMSEYTGVSDIETILNELEEWEDIGAVAITDINSVQAFPRAAKCRKNHGTRVLYGMTASVLHEGEVTACMLLVKNRTGRTNLFRLVSEAYKKENRGIPLIDWEFLTEHRDGLFVGAACDGEVIKTVLSGKDDYYVTELIRGYDYIEIQPIANIEDMIKRDQAEFEYKRLVRLAEKEKVPVVAVSNAAYIYPADQLKYRVLTGARPLTKSDKSPRYLRGLNDMIYEFFFLGKKKAEGVVRINPNKIAAACEEINHMESGYHPPHFPDEDQRLDQICNDSAERLYGNPLPETVHERLQMELESIHSNEYAGHYLLAKLVADKVKEMGYMSSIRGSAGASLAAFLCGITDVDPLPAHYYCPDCHRFEVFSEHPEDYHYIGYDLPEKRCPVCGSVMKKGGFNIPYESFSGESHDREPDFDFNVPSAIWRDLYGYLQEVFGEDNILRPCVFWHIGMREAERAIGKYSHLYGNEEFVARTPKTPAERLIETKLELAAELKELKRGERTYPGGVIIVPRDVDINEISPVQFLPSGEKIAHLDYHEIAYHLWKLDILSHDVPEMLHDLEIRTGFGISGIPFDDKETMDLFQRQETLGLPEFDFPMAKRIMTACGASSFGDLVRVSALCHSTGAWSDYAESLIFSGRKLWEIVTSRDDILLFLESKGMDIHNACVIMDCVRKGKKKPDDVFTGTMRDLGIPEWYIGLCDIVQYLFPKAHCASYVKMTWRMAYYKAHFPKEFYSTVLRYETIPEEIRQDPGRLDELIEVTEADEEDLDLGTWEKEHCRGGGDRLRPLYLLAEARNKGCDLKEITRE